MADFKLAAELEITGVNASKALNSLRSQLNGAFNTSNITKLDTALKAPTITLQEISKAADDASKSTKRATTSIKGTANAMQDFGDKAGLALRRFAAFSLAAGATFGTFSVIRKQLADAIAFERELVRVAQVTQSSLGALSGLRREIGSLSVEFGTSASTIANTAQVLAQAGLSARDTEIALRSITQSNLSATFKDIGNTTEGVIASMRQFGIQAEDVGQTLDIVNAVAGKFAVESNDIITAIQKAGSVFSTSSRGIVEGNEALAQFAATFTSIRATTRESADTIATGLRTIFSRLQRPKTIEFLRQFGIELTDLEDKFVGPYEALQRLGDGLRQLDPRDLRFAAIVEQLGGLRQVSRVIPAIQQTALANEALSVALGSQGSVAREAALAQETLSVKIQSTRENFADLFREIADTGSFKAMVNSLLELANAFIDVAKTAKEVLPILAALGAARGISFGAKAIPSFVRRVRTNTPGFQTGGKIPGVGSGDKILFAGEPGEFVLNRNAVKQIGVQNLHKINKNIPRFQTGGQLGGSGGNGGSNFSKLFQTNLGFNIASREYIKIVAELGVTQREAIANIIGLSKESKGAGEAINKLNDLLRKAGSDIRRNQVNSVRSQNQSRLSSFYHNSEPIPRNRALVGPLNPLGVPVGLPTPQTRGPIPGQSLLMGPISNRRPGVARNRSLSGPLSEEDQILGVLNGFNDRAAGEYIAGRRTSVRSQLLAGRPGGGTSADVRSQILDQQIISRRNRQAELVRQARANSQLSPSQLSSLSSVTADFSSPAFDPSNTSSQRDGRFSRHARTRARLARTRLRRRFTGRGGRVAAGGLGALAAIQASGGGFDPGSPVGDAAQSSLFAFGGARLLGLNPITAGVGAVAAGASSFLSARTQQNTDKAVEKLNTSISEVSSIFEKFTGRFDSVANGELGRSLKRFSANFNALREDQIRRTSTGSSIAGAIGGGLGMSDDVNARIASGRGSLSFLGSRITDGAISLTGLGFTEFGQEIRSDIIKRDIEVENELNNRDALERANAAAPIAEQARARIREAILSGVKVNDIDKEILLASERDNAASLHATDEGRINNAFKKANEFARSAIAISVNSYNELNNVLPDFIHHLEGVNRAIGFISESASFRRAATTALATGQSVSFGQPNVFKNTADLSPEKFRQAIAKLDQNLGTRTDDNLLFAGRLPRLQKEFQSLTSREGTLSDSEKVRLEGVKLEIDAAKAAADALINIQEESNKMVAALRQELDVRNQLSARLDALNVSRIAAGGNLAQRRFELFDDGPGRQGPSTTANILAQVRSLAGTSDSNQILRNINNIEQQRRTNAASGASDLQKQTIESELVRQLDKNNAALTILASDISDLSDIQRKLADIERQRVGVRGLIEGGFQKNFTDRIQDLRGAEALRGFNASGGNLQAAIRNGFTREDIFRGFQNRQERLEIVNPDQAEKERIEFNKNALRARGINPDRPEDFFDAETARAIRNALTPRGQGAEEQGLRKEFDAIAARQLQAMQAQADVVRGLVQNFNNDIVNNLGRHVQQLREAANHLNKDITVTFKPVDVNVNVNGAEVFSQLNPLITTLIRDGVDRALRIEREGR